MASENHIFKLSNAGGFKSATRYPDMLAGNAVWNPWEPQGAFDALATVTLNATTASLTFSGIPTGYKHLQVRALFQTTRATYNIDDIDLAFNGVVTGGTYARHYLEANIQNNGTVNAGGNASADKMVYMATGTSTVSANCFGGAVLDILDYASTSKFKTVRSLSGGDANGGASGYFPTVSLRSGVWMSTSAITSMTFNTSFGGSSFAANSTFALYGVK